MILQNFTKSAKVWYRFFMEQHGSNWLNPRNIELTDAYAEQLERESDPTGQNMTKAERDAEDEASLQELMEWGGFTSQQEAIDYINRTDPA